MQERQQNLQRARGRYFHADRWLPAQPPDRSAPDQRAPRARREAPVPERGAGNRKAAPERPRRRPQRDAHQQAEGTGPGRTILRAHKPGTDPAAPDPAAPYP
jgi:hypothetical protein